MRIGRVDTSRITNGYRLIKYLLNGRFDSRETRQVQPPGIDSSPINGDNIIHSPTGNKGEDVNIGIVDNKHRLANPGETRLYVVDQNGDEVGELYMKQDGTYQFAGGTDNAVRFSSLQTSFNELQQSHNNLVNQWNAFASVYLPGGPTTQGLPPTANTATQSTTNIDNSRVDEINIP